MKRFLFLIWIIPQILFSQTETRILSYDVSVILNNRAQEITGKVHVDVKMTDSTLMKYSFFVPKEWIMNSIRDGKNASLNIERFASSLPHFDLVTIELSDKERKEDNLSLNIDFTADLDSSSFLEMFINQKEFLLPYDSSISWLPRFGSLTAERLSIEFKIEMQFTVIGEQIFDTASTDGMRTWKRDIFQPTLLSSAFTICGIQNAVQQSSLSPDSLYSVIFYSSPVKFNQQYALAIVQQINNAVQFFTVTAKQKRIRRLTYAIVGDKQLEKNNQSINGFSIRRNSHVFSLFDSSALTRSKYNSWVTDVARRFCPMTNDSMALFDDGFAAYLCSRFLITSFPQIDKHERIDAISNALTFFPAEAIAAGHTARGNTNNIISFKGRYVFFMLEYILGKESFDNVIAAMLDRFSSTRISISDFQLMCETEYGSSLDWFFGQWLYRTSAPELVLQWKSEKTPRGVSVVSASIEQRGVPFSMPVPLVFSFGSRTVTKQVFVEQSKQEFTFTFPMVPTSVDCDPHYSILRWLLEIRISAHARTALQFLSINRDVVNAEREAFYTIQLDPNNSTGSAPLAFFILGNISVLNNNVDRAKEYFMKASSSFGSEETDQYRLLSLVRYGNIIEKDGKREEAVNLYRRAISEGLRSPLIFEYAIFEAEKCLRFPFVSNEDVWYEIR